MSEVQIYNVGPHGIDSDGCETYQWVVAWYEYGSYEGDGEAVSFDGADYRLHGLSHCSCYGTEEGMQRGAVVPLETILGDSVTPGDEIKPEVVAKVRELVAATLSESKPG